jgi:cathepsin A (carboxypeptidase C)
MLTVELGGCNIANQGENVTYNEHSWNNVANMLYLDRELSDT